MKNADIRMNINWSDFKNLTHLELDNIESLYYEKLEETNKVYYIQGFTDHSDIFSFEDNEFFNGRAVAKSFGFCPIINKY